MTNKRFNKRMIDLIKLIPISHFRTVESFEILKAKTEVHVEIDLKDNFIKKLNFPVPWDGKLYAYARCSEGLLGLCSDNNIKFEEIKKIYLEDWDDKFAIIFEIVDREKEFSYYTSIENMKELLENCCRAPSQR